MVRWQGCSYWEKSRMDVVAWAANRNQMWEKRTDFWFPVWLIGGWKLPVSQKLNKQKWYLCLELSDDWSHRAHLCPQNGREIDKEIHNQPTSRHLYGKQCRGRKSSTVVDQLQEAQCRQVWGGPRPRAPPPFCELHFKELHQVLTVNSGERSSHVSDRGMEKVSILTYTEPSCPYQGLPTRKPS